LFWDNIHTLFIYYLYICNCYCRTKYCIDVKSISSMILFSSKILQFWLGCSICSWDGLLRSTTIIVSGSVCSFIFRKVCFMNLKTLTFTLHVFRVVISSWWLVPILICSDYLCISEEFLLKAASSNMTISCLISTSCLLYSPSFHFSSVCDFGCMVCFLWLTKFWILLFKQIRQSVICWLES
jgi:hypothetical protein